MKRTHRSFILCIIIAICSVAIGIAMLPPFGVGQTMLNALLALVVGACMIAFVLPEIMSTRGIICILNFFEFLLLAVVALVLVVLQVLPFMEFGTCRLLAIALWIHGMVGIFKIYNTRIASMKKGLAFPLFINIILISVASYLFAVPFLSEIVMSWAFSLFFFVLAFLMIALSLLYAPKAKKKKIYRK